MLKYLFRTLKYLFRATIGLVALLCLYTLAIFLCLWFPVNKDFEKTLNRDIPIYIVSNGVHTDLLLPLDMSQKTDQLIIENQNHGSLPAYIAYGWGDKGFYLETPTWADLKFSTAFKAVTGLSSAAMHITLYKHAPQLDESTFKILVNTEQLAKLRTYVGKDFIYQNNKLVYINCCWYHNDHSDAFYDSRGSYSLFKTCNVWTNAALKDAGIKTAAWAPFSDCVTYHLK